ncbi:dethiobiotin synthase [Radiobacillus deserti]|uniref:ATP-dependent dethiobiotin synthetase BioD n=1 Tax=Radiobacillus deserti TaxID=2594883 RepID=A0A516KDM2_9BACI|nr:dethiobiotin synthase [Radiobacillus deserti]QDP39512.1 dethiobiotin synthase [Radiobacillus deserti]
MPGVFITATSKNIGKTVLTTCLTYALNKKGIDTVPYKPVQCGAIQKDGSWVSPDAEVYRNVYQPRNEEEINTYLYKPRFSPHLAAQLANDPINPKKILSNYEKLEQDHDFVLVEGPGGLAVPLIDEHYGNAELVKDLNLPLFVVASAEVGTLNHTVMTVSYARSKHIDVQGIILNQYPEHPSEGIQENPVMLEKMTGVPVIGMVPHVDDIETKLKDKAVLDIMTENIDVDYIANESNS